MKAVRVASIFARDSGNIVKIVVSGDKLTIVASTSQVGSNEAEIAVKTTGKGGEIAFNFRYLIEALGVIEAPEVVFEMSESLTPGKLTSEGSADFFHIIMPVRLQG